jgi:hypothetical protein
MTQEEAIKAFESVGLEAKPCANPLYIELRVGVATDPDEKMRATADGQLLWAKEGYFWQVIALETLAIVGINKGETQ